MAYITGTSNYPQDYDINPTGAGVEPALAFVLDEIRDPITGVVTQSGNTVVAVDVNSIYSINDKVERTLGVNPQDTFGSVAERLDYLAYSGVLAFLPITGGSMAGALTIPSGIEFNASNIVSSGLIWTVSTGASIIVDGGITLAGTGNFRLSSSNLYLAGTLLEGTGNNINFLANNDAVLSGTNSVSLKASGNEVVMESGATTLTHDLTPTVAQSGNVNLGSADAYFGTLYVNDLATTGGSFVPVTGGNFLGDVNITGANLNLSSGAGILNDVASVNNLGSSGYPFGDIYTTTLNASFVSGLSPITFLSELQLHSGVSITFSGSDSTMGSVSQPLDTLYVTNIIGATGLDESEIVMRSGATMYGDLELTGTSNLILDGAGNNILTNVSGSSAIGISGTPISGVWTDEINGKREGNLRFNEPLTATGDPRIWTLDHTPVADHSMIFVSGILVRPAIDYDISANTLTFTGTFPTPVTTPYAGFYIY